MWLYELFGHKEISLVRLPHRISWTETPLMTGDECRCASCTDTPRYTTPNIPPPSSPHTQTMRKQYREGFEAGYSTCLTHFLEDLRRRGHHEAADDVEP